MIWKNVPIIQNSLLQKDQINSAFVAKHLLGMWAGFSMQSIVWVQSITAFFLLQCSSAQNVDWKIMHVQLTLHLPLPPPPPPLCSISQIWKEIYMRSFYYQQLLIHLFHLLLFHSHSWSPFISAILSHHHQALLHKKYFPMMLYWRSKYIVYLTLLLLMQQHSIHHHHLLNGWWMVKKPKPNWTHIYYCISLTFLFLLCITGMKLRRKFTKTGRTLNYCNNEKCTHIYMYVVYVYISWSSFEHYPPPNTFFPFPNKKRICYIFVIIWIFILFLFFQRK